MATRKKINTDKKYGVFAFEGDGVLLHSTNSFAEARKWINAGAKKTIDGKKVSLLWTKPQVLRYIYP